MLYGGSFDMDEHSSGTRSNDYAPKNNDCNSRNSEDNSKDANSNRDENDINCASKYNDNHDNSNSNNEEDMEKSLRGRGRGRGARLSMQHDDLTSKESLSLARFICAQV
jgi:hypothetical protein